MSGAAAAGSRYAALHHLIVIPHTRGDLPIHSRHKAYRCRAIESRRAFGAGGFRQVTERAETLRACRPRRHEAGCCANRLYRANFFTPAESREADEQIIYGADTDGLLPTCCIRMNGSMAQS